MDDLQQITTAARNESNDLGGSIKRDVPLAAGAERRGLQARQAAPPYTESNQFEICAAFSEVSRNSDTSRRAKMLTSYSGSMYSKDS